MEDLGKKILYTGLGIFAITKEKIEARVEEWIEKGKITREEGQKLYEELKTDSQKSGEAFANEIKEWVRTRLEQSGLPSKESFEKLEARVAALEKQAEHQTDV